MTNSIRFPIRSGGIIRHFILIIISLFLSACVHSNGISPLPSENYNSRVSIIVIHHTTANFEESVALLTQPSNNPVSSHYLIPEPNDDTYTDDELKIFELVPESQRAWHAGRSYWAGKTGLNDQSIGIEIVNNTHCTQLDDTNASPEENSGTAGDQAAQPEKLCFYPDFAESQIKILLELLQDIHERYPQLKPTNIVGHSDIAPSRKIDPGPRFPWQRLYQLGFGAWYDEETVSRYWKKFSAAPLPLINIQKALHAYGYKIEETGILDTQTQNVLRAFQMHFRPSGVTSEATVETMAILFALIEKYHPNALDELLVIEPQPEDPLVIPCQIQLNN